MLSIVIPVLNQHELLHQTLKLIVDNLDGYDTEILIIDNGSDKKFEYSEEFLKIARNKCQFIAIKRYEEPIGNYPAFKIALEQTHGEYIAVIHSDLAIYEKGFNTRIVNEFKNRERLGLIGFVGSTEVDYFGGRGGGTKVNFMGKEVISSSKVWKGSTTEAHWNARRINNFINGVVVDGCSMVFRKKALEEIGFRDDFPLHHFYDRLMSFQILEKGWQVGILGIEIDHFSGQTVNQEPKYHKLANDWMSLRYTNQEEWMKKNEGWWRSNSNPSRGQTPNNADHWLYMEAERLFLTEYRDAKRLIPKRI